jgi:hypothetical protein
LVKAQSAEALTFGDVVQAHIYMAPDPHVGGGIDFAAKRRTVAADFSFFHMALFSPRTKTVRGIASSVAACSDEARRRKFIAQTVTPHAQRMHKSRAV